MVLNLFIPAGEGQYRLIPKRPDPLGADATLQYAVIGSAALAGTYTSFASSHARRVHPSRPVPRIATFVRSSARLGVWAGALGVAANCYYYNAFVGVIMTEQNLPVKPWKLYERTKRVTVDDGALAGAALGLATSMPTLLMRRPAIPRWTRVVGATNIGACAGMLGAHAYLQYNGERQKAYVRLEQRMKRRALEYWGIFGDKELMSRFDPLIQQYITHHAMWYSSHMVYDASEQPVSTSPTANQATEICPASAPAEPPPEAYYVPPYDYLEYLKQIDVERQRTEMEELEIERHSLLKESDYVFRINAERKHRYCHTTEMTDDERARWLRELHLCEITYNRLASAVNVNDIKIAKIKLALQHKAAFEARAQTKSSVESWLPPMLSTNLDTGTHDPTMTIQELEKFRAEIVADITRFEESLTTPGFGESQRERWRKDIEDARVFLKAVDQVVWELENEKNRLRVKTEEAPGGEEKEVIKSKGVGVAEKKANKKGKGVERLQVEKP
ncbi:hypothetical protein BDU57DRAFT_509500 [Ampelomyces quisqualis]|uniref:Uncharacterized protein n=1 Tax=Ampelomyces quisqualis TaxID=50730 RepID=A0A6A5R1G7_AMPQU|nr:hypothetical protein BDU57DRAFT_509500 [Ampelomyces quisqualis]